MKKIKLIAIVGPTATGKTTLSISLAKAFKGEIVSADSMQVYRNMCIATAKPSLEEMEDIPHHLVDFLDLNKSFSVSDYVRLAHECIVQIINRGGLPMVVGGTGLYIDSLLHNIKFAEESPQNQLRKQLYKQATQDGGKQLYQELCEIDPEAAAKIHPHNLVRVIRGVEIYRQTGKTLTEHKKDSRPQHSIYDAMIIGLTFKDREKLYDRIEKRVDDMIHRGLVEEAEHVLQQQAIKTARYAIGYKELIPYFSGKDSLDTCIHQIKVSTRHYAKRQLTWFARSQNIQWIYLDDLNPSTTVFKKAQEVVEKFLLT